MSSILRNGWHPKGKGEGGKESWRGDFKGINQVARLAGRGKNKSANGLQTGLNHSSAPLSTLKDPASFGPPPKHVATHGTPTTYPSLNTNPTGQTSSHMNLAPQPTPEPIWQSPQSSATPQRPRPALPPRQNSRPDTHNPDPPPSYDAAVVDTLHKHDHANQAAVDQLGKATMDASEFKSAKASSEMGRDGQVREHNAQVTRAPEMAANFQAEHYRGPERSWAQKQSLAEKVLSFQQHSLLTSDANGQNNPATALASGKHIRSDTTCDSLAANSADHRKEPEDARKRPPPPPPPKRKELKKGQAVSGSEPPPLPISSKPRF